MFKATLSLPAKIDVTLGESDVADAIEAVNRPFLPDEFRGLTMDRMVSDLAGNVYGREMAMLGDDRPMPVVFRRDRGRAAMVDAYHTLKHQRLDHRGGDPVGDLLGAAKEVLAQLDNGFPVLLPDVVTRHLRAAVARAEAR